MAEKINIDELKVMIANQIKNENLNEVLDSVNIEEIAKNILSRHKRDNAVNAIPDVIPENTEAPAMATSPVSMPQPEVDNSVPTSKYFNPSNNLDSFGTGTTNSPAQVDQSTSGNIPAYEPALPSFMDKIEPAKVIVFDMNELSQGGENLSHKPLRTFENPDVKKSMNDLWTEEGKRKADVYIVKLEKIGGLDFNYTNGTTRFDEKRFDPDFAVQATYRENPYAASDAMKSVESQSNIMNQISTAVDLESVVKNIVMDLIKKGITTDLPRESYGYDTSQAVKPMEESVPGYAARGMFKSGGDIDEINEVAESFDLNMAKLVDDEGSFKKAELPDSLKEHIGSGDREFLRNENQEVEEWHFDGTSYFLPKNRISKNKGYVFKN
jgi:hypothetical protein